MAIGQEFETDRTELLLTKWHEAFFGIDFALLLTSPVYYCAGVPRGDGSAVIVVPGFMHGDASLVIMYAWLKRLGYQPYYSRIWHNADCPDILIREHLMAALEDARRESGRKVHLIGHSLGGVMARSVAAQRPRDVASVITLGSPFRGRVVHRSILRDTEKVRNRILIERGENVRADCYTSECGCAFIRNLRRGVLASVAQTAIYTRNDGVVDWRCCIVGQREVDVEVAGTHAGLAFNPRAYSVIAERLAVASLSGRAKAKGAV
jgi:pimeloyl-ACP methyl ester carboxylesterase